jgi:hypothetical protein
MVVLAQPDQLAAASDVSTQLGSALGQETVGDGLREPENVRMGGVHLLGPRLVDAGEITADLVFVAVLEKSLQQAPLIHHLDAAWSPSERTTFVGSASFSSTSTRTPCVRSSLASIMPVGPPRTLESFDYLQALASAKDVRHNPGLAASPRVRYTVQWRGVPTLPFVVFRLCRVPASLCPAWRFGHW